MGPLRWYFEHRATENIQKAKTQTTISTKQGGRVGVNKQRQWNLSCIKLQDPTKIKLQSKGGCRGWGWFTDRCDLAAGTENTKEAIFSRLFHLAPAYHDSTIRKRVFPSPCSVANQNKSNVLTNHKTLVVFLKAQPPSWMLRTGFACSLYCMLHQ